MNYKPKLELTWIGKGEQPRLEPRILIEDPSRSYGDKNSRNMLIHGDNLLALRALEQDYLGQIKCVFIDPPFNTGSAFKHYNDSLEHSLWLSMMAERLKLLRTLLCPSGAIFVNLDDTESAYCKVIMDEIFGRNNYVTTVVVEAATASSFKTVNVGPTQTAQYVFIYAKDKSQFEYKQQYVPIYQIDLQHFSRFIDNPEALPTKWRFRSINEHILEEMGFKGESINAKWAEAKKKMGADESKREVQQRAMHFALDNCQRVFETKTLQKPSKWLHEHLERSAKSDSVIELKRENMESLFLYKGRQIYFLGKAVKEVDGEKVVTQPVSNIWNDIPTNNLQQEGGVDFPAGKKPESLIRRIIQMVSDKTDDIILDSFAGSGTTGAVAQKMNRKWIMIELGEHCDTHCLPRLRGVCEGTDQSGVSRLMNWKGGGGFKYYYLAPSLLQQDNHGNWVINKKHNSVQLAAAMAKHEGFKLHPDQSLYWKQGKSTEKDFIFTTTNFVSVEFIDTIHGEMKSDESLLICCTSFSKAADKHPNITIKKIPKILLGRCEFGKEDYSLNIVNMPKDNDELNFVPTGRIASNKPKDKKRKDDTEDLFASTKGGKK